MGSGRYTDVYDIGHGRVLRRYRDASAVARRECEVMTHARAHGVPARTYLSAAGPVGPRWLAAAVEHRRRDPSLLEAEAARLRRLARRGRFAGYPHPR